jgi:hypothetical protein
VRSAIPFVVESLIDYFPDWVSSKGTFAQGGGNHPKPPSSVVFCKPRDKHFGPPVITNPIPPPCHARYDHPLCLHSLPCPASPTYHPTLLLASETTKIIPAPVTARHPPLHHFPLSVPPFINLHTMTTSTHSDPNQGQVDLSPLTAKNTLASPSSPHLSAMFLLPNHAPKAQVCTQLYSSPNPTTQT